MPHMLLFALLYTLCLPSALSLALSRNPAAADVSLSLPATELPWQCWDPNIPRLVPAGFDDCRRLAEAIQLLRPEHRPYHVGDPITWGTQDEADFGIPLAISVGTCRVGLLPLSSELPVTDTFTSRYLAHALNRMSQQCVNPAPHFGGEGSIGPKQVVALTVTGFDEPP